MLPLRLEPMADETLVGLIVRIARLNSQSDVLWFARSLGIPFTVLSAAGTRRFDLAPLAGATGLSAGSLEAAACWPLRPGMVNFRGHDLNRVLVSVAARRACPRCLAASPHHRAGWDVRPLDVCPVHSVRLIRRCPSCRRPLGWTSVHLDRCPCGAILAHAEAQAVGQDDMAGVLEAYRLLGLPVGVAAAPPPCPVQIGDLGANAVIDLMWDLGRMSLARSDNGRAVRGRSADRAHAALAIGYRAVADWPTSFHRYVDEFRRDEDRRKGRFGARRALGPVADWAASLEVGGRLRETVTDALRRHEVLAATMATRSAAVPSATRDSDAVTLTKAARTLRRSVVTLGHALVAERLVDHSDGQGRGAPVLVNGPGLRKLSAMFADLCDKRALANSMGCGRKTLDAILAAGVLRPVAPGVGMSETRRWRLSDATALISGLEARVSGRSRPGVGLPAAMRFLRQAGLSPARAAAALLVDGPAPTGVDAAASGLSRLVFDRQDLGLLLESARPPERTISAPEFAVRSGVKQEIVYRLLRSGMIASERRAHERGRRIPVSEVTRFQAEFVLPGTMAAAVGCRKGWLAIRLLAAGARPVSGPSVDGGRHWVFMRAEVESLSLGWE